MARCARPSSTSAIQRLLLLLSIYWRVNHEADGQRVGLDAGSSDVDDAAAAVSKTFHCSTATIFRLVTVDCEAQNASSVRQLPLDRHRHNQVNSLRLADNRLIRLGPDEFGRVAAHLQQLYVARNFIADVDQHAFRNVRTLQVDCKRRLNKYTKFEIHA